MNTLLDRHVARSVLVCVLLSWLLLVSLFTFLGFVEQLGDTGRGSYGVYLAGYYILLNTPHIALELMPISVAVGAMVGLGILANNGELVVIRSSGMSRPAFALALLKAGFLLIILHILLGELVAPHARNHAVTMRSVALYGETAGPDGGFWTVSDGRYVNVRHVLSGERLEDIYIYEFDDEHRLRTSTHAARGHYQDGQWILQDLTRSGLTSDRAETRHVDKMVWDIALDPEFVADATATPRSLSALGMLRHIRHARDSGQDSQRHIHALLVRLLEPVSIILMLLLAVVVVRPEARNVSIAARVGLGSLLGIGWHILRDMFSNLGIVYGIEPLFSVVLPPLVLLSLILWRLGRL